MHGISPEEYDEYEGSLSAGTPRRAKRTRRSISLPLAIAIGLAMALLGSGVAVAATGFSDVPDDHQFADQISWMASTGISEGYPDGTYRPNLPVSRQAMSAFMQNLYDLQDDMSYATNPNVAAITSTTWVDVAGMTTTVIVPAGTWANLSARYSAETRTDGPVNAWGSVKLLVSRNGGTFTELSPAVGANGTFDSEGGATDWEAHAIERVTTVDGGTYTIKAQAIVSASTLMDLDDMTLVAETDLQPSDYIPS